MILISNNLMFKMILQRFFATGSERSKKYKKNTALIIILQGINTLASFLLVSATLDYLGVKEYGVWITLTSILAWFNILDVGLAHGLRNRYAEAKASNNLAEIKGLVSTAFFGLVFLSLLVFLIMLAVAYFTSWSSLLNAPISLEYSLKIVGVVMISTLCLKLVTNIVNVLKTADQQPAISTLLIAIGNILAVTGIIFLIKFSKPSFVYLGIVLAVAQILPVLVAFTYLFSSSYKEYFPSWKCFSMAYVKSIFFIGIKFFAVQITGLLVLQSNILIIAHVCGQEFVTQYNIAYKYLWIIMILFVAIITPMWSASTESYIKKDITWLKNSMKSVQKMWYGLILVGIVLVALSSKIYQIWLGDDIKADYLLLILMLLYFIVTMRYSMFRMFMNGVGKIKLQFIVSFCQLLVHIPITIISAKLYGMYGVILTNLLWALINSIWEPMQYKRIISGRDIGIWGK